jgi:hypothetical protein
LQYPNPGEATARKGDGGKDRTKRGIQMSTPKLAGWTDRNSLRFCVTADDLPRYGELKHLLNRVLSDNGHDPSKVIAVECLIEYVSTTDNPGA